MIYEAAKGARAVLPILVRENFPADGRAYKQAKQS
jgi:hypothetical protein